MAIEGTRDKIINVATKLFSRFGFHKTSMDEIAKISRKAKGSLYYHFSSKEDLFKEVVSEEMINLKSHLSIIVEDDKLDGQEKLKKYLITRMEVLNNASNYHETIKADFFEHFDFIDSVRTELDNWEKENLKIIVNQGIAEGNFEDNENIDVVIDVIIMVLKGLEIPLYLQDKYDTYSPHFDGLMGILTKGLAR